MPAPVRLVEPCWPLPWPAPDPEPLLLRCRVTNDVARVYWYINDQFFKSGGARGKEFFVPDEGPVKISCTDDKGRNRNIWIRVRYVDL